MLVKQRDVWARARPESTSDESLRERVSNQRASDSRLASVHSTEAICQQRPGACTGSRPQPPVSGAGSVCFLNWPEGQHFWAPTRCSSGETTWELMAQSSRCAAQGPGARARLLCDAQASVPSVCLSSPSLSSLTSYSPRLPTDCTFPTARHLLLHTHKGRKEGLVLEKNPNYITYKVSRINRTEIYDKEGLSFSLIDMERYHVYARLETRVFPMTSGYWTGCGLRRLLGIGQRFGPTRAPGMPSCWVSILLLPCLIPLVPLPTCLQHPAPLHQHEVLFTLPLEKRLSAAVPGDSCKSHRRQELEAALQDVLYEKKARKQEIPPGFGLFAHVEGRNDGNCCSLLHFWVVPVTVNWGIPPNYPGSLGEILPSYCLTLNKVMGLISPNCNTTQNIDLEAKIFTPTLLIMVSNCQYDNGPQISNLQNNLLCIQTYQANYKDLWTFNGMKTSKFFKK